MTKLSENDISLKLKNLPNWSLNKANIERKLKFNNFIEAFSFMTQIAIIAEKLNHHPDWNNCYNKLNISLTTHDAGGITEKDFELANLIENLLPKSDKV